MFTKKYVWVFFFICLLALNSLVVGSKQVTHDETIYVSVSDLAGKDFTDKEVIKDFIVAHVRKSSLCYWNKGSLNLNRNAIIFISHGIDVKKNNSDYKVEENSSILRYILHKERKKWSPFISNARRVLIVLLGGENDLQLANIKVERKPSEFKQSFLDLVEFVKATKEKFKTLAVGGKIPCRFIDVNLESIRSPVAITVAHESFKEEFKFMCYRKNILLFRLGVVSSFLDRKHFKIEDNRLVVDVENKDERAEIKSNLILMLNFHLPRIGDRLEHYSPLRRIPERMGPFIGVKLGSDPLDKLYLGLSYSIYKDLDIIGGISWHTVVKVSDKDLGDIKSVQDAVDYMERKYSKPRFFVGLAFAPSAMGKLLGLKK